MTIHMGYKDGEFYITTGPMKPRKEDLNKWLGRNRDAVLVKLIGHPEPSAPCSVGHICRVEKINDDPAYIVFVGRHPIGQLPEEAIAFADHVGSSPEFLVSIVGKVEDGDVFVYIAE